MALINLDAEIKPNKVLSSQHRGIVVNNADPLGKGRVKCLIEGIYETSCPADILPWVYPATSTTYRADLGGFTAPPVGAEVYIYFANGDIYHPMYTGAAGDMTNISQGNRGSSIRPYDGAVDNNSKEPEKYDANHKTTRQGPTETKEDSYETAFFGPNSQVAQVEGATAEKTFGAAFSQISDDGTQTGEVNFLSYDRVNNMLDLALKSLGVHMHIDNQGRIWLNVTKDVMVTLGGKLYTYVQGEYNLHVEGESNLERVGEVHEVYGNNLTRKGKSIIENLSGSSLLKASGSREVDVSNHRTKASGTITRASPTVSDTNNDPLEDSPGEGGQPALDKREENFEKTVKPERTKREVFVQEVVRGHGIQTEAASSISQTQTQNNLARAQELSLSGLNDRIIGGTDSNPVGVLGPSSGSSGLLGSLLGSTGLSSVVNKISSVLPTGLSSAISSLGGGDIGKILSPVLNSSLGSTLSSILGKTGLSNLPLSSTILNDVSSLQQILAAVSNKSQLTDLLSSAIRNQLTSRLPSNLVNSGAIEKVIDTVITQNVLGVLPDGQSPASSLERIVQKANPDNILSYFKNYLGYDEGFFYTNGSYGVNTDGTLKYASDLDSGRAIGMQAKVLSEQYGQSDILSLIKEQNPALSAEQAQTVADKVRSSISQFSIPNTQSVVNDPTLLATYQTSLIEESNTQKADTNQIQMASDQVAQTSTSTNAVLEGESLEEGKLPITLASVSSATNSISSVLKGNMPQSESLDTAVPFVPGASGIASSCEAKEESAVGTPAQGFQYSPEGDTSLGGTGSTAGNAVGDYGISQGNVEDGPWDYKYYTKADFKPGQWTKLKRSTLQAFERVTEAYGKKLTILSAYRSPSYNAGVGGAKNSMHMKGLAIDVSTAGMSTAEKQKLLTCAIQQGFSSIGYYQNFIHIDTRGSGTTWGAMPSWAAPVIANTGWKRGQKPFGGRSPDYEPQDTGGSPGGGMNTGDNTTTPETPTQVPGETPQFVGTKPIPYQQTPKHSTPMTSREQGIEIVARTLYGEVAGQSFQQKLDVASVIMNRVKSGRWGNNPVSVCLWRKQFSCWNSGEGGLQPRITRVTSANRSFRDCLKVAQMLIDGTLKDTVNGADHYYNPKVANPDWAHSPRMKLVKSASATSAHAFYRST